MNTASNKDLGTKISVCLLTYNHADLIESTINSILNQTIRDQEVIVSDDCSTDETWHIIQKIAKQDSRIKPIRTPQNMGMAGNANYAVSHSDRPYIALLHHDDIYREDLLEKWGNILHQNKSTAFVFNPYRVYDSNLIYQDDMPGECIDGSWLLKNYLLRRWGCVVRGTAMIRRSAWIQVGGMREKFGLLSDVDLWMRLAMSWDVGYVAEPLIAIRQQRPENYPTEYKETSWSWHRRRILYEIHATNTLTYWNPNTLMGRIKWWAFRIKVSTETAKWLIYSLIRNKPDIITTSHDSITDYDLWPLRVFRYAVKKMHQIKLAAHTP